MRLFPSRTSTQGNFLDRVQSPKRVNSSFIAVVAPFMVKAGPASFISQVSGIIS